MRASYTERLDERMVDGGLHCGLNVLTSRSVSPHIDSDFHAWSVLWILSAGVDHHLWVADHVPSNPWSETTRRPMKRPKVYVPLRPGTLVRFHAHRTHWMDTSSDKVMLQAVSDDFDKPPTLEEAQAVFEEALTRFQPELSTSDLALSRK